MSKDTYVSESEGVGKRRHKRLSETNDGRIFEVASRATELSTKEAI